MVPVRLASRGTPQSHAVRMTSKVHPAYTRHTAGADGHHDQGRPRRSAPSSLRDLAGPVRLMPSSSTSRCRESAEEATVARKIRELIKDLEQAGFIDRGAAAAIGTSFIRRSRDPSRSRGDLATMREIPGAGGAAGDRGGDALKTATVT